MADWFLFCGIKSTALGVYVTMYPPITLPEERVEFVEVPGRSGSLTVMQGDVVYDDVLLSVECLMKDLSQLDQMSAWLRGAGDLVLGNRPGTYYKARVVNQIELTKLVRGRPHRTFSVVFRCAPFRYLYPVPKAITFNAPGDITNPGTVYAEPIITVTGNGDIDLLIGGKVLQLASVSGSITIDVPARLAYSGDTNQSYKLTGDWPLLPTGTFNVSWTGSVNNVSVLPHWRCI